MGIEGSDQGVAGIDAAAGKKVSSGSPPRRGERIEETARVIGGRRPRCVRGRADEKSFTFHAMSTSNQMTAVCAQTSPRFKLR